MKTKLLLLLSLVVFWGAQGQVSQAEREALIALYNATDGDNWTNNTNWDTDPNSNSDVSTWHGVSILRNGLGEVRVSRVDLFNNNLTGTLPDLSGLISTTIIRLEMNNISGELDLSKLPSVIQYLYLFDNNLTGQIPDFSGSNMVQLRLDNNNLQGNLSEAMFPTSLDMLTLSENNFSGELDLSSFNNLTSVAISDTGISYLQIPASVNGNNQGALRIKNTPKLAYVEVNSGITNFYNLRNSYFDIGVRIVSSTTNVDRSVRPVVSEREAIPRFFIGSGLDIRYSNTIRNGSNDKEWIETEEINGELRITGVFIADRTLFNNEVPSQVNALSALKQLNLTGCSLQRLPPEIGDLPELQILNLSQNSLASLPVEFGSLPKLENLVLTSNLLTSLPEEFYNLSTLKNLSIHFNQIPTLSDSLGNLTALEQFNFSSNSIDEIPSSVGNLVNMKTIQFQNNRITLLPPELGNLRLLTSITGSNNQIASIPSEFGQLTLLKLLDLSSNSISNTPAEFSNLTELETLYLNNNDLQVIAGLGGFTKLKFLRLHNNRLGEDNAIFDTKLPSNIGDLSLLQELTLHDNKLTELPNTIGSLTLLTELPLQNNRLGSLPSGIGSLNGLKKLQLQNNQLTGLPVEIGNLSALEELNITNQTSFNTETIYHLTSLPTTITNLTSLKRFEASSNRIEGDIDLSNSITLNNLQLFDNRISGLKLGTGPFSTQVTFNPNLSCIEVPSDQVASWKSTSLNTVSTDNGVDFSDNCSGFRVPQLEREALIAFYNATGGGTNWNGQFWNTDPNSLSNVGAWGGVTTAIVNGQKHVVKLEVRNSGLNGFIPSEIKNLTELVELNLGIFNGRGNLTEVKPEIGELTKLERLDLTGHKLSTLPTEIGTLSSLVYLELSNNSLTSLPSGIGSLNALEELRITSQNNTTTGEKTLASLPNEIGGLTSLKKLSLQGNRLTSIPNTINGLTALEDLNLGDNSGNGNELSTLPSTIGALLNLKTLNIAYNRLNSLPDEIGNLSSLESLYLSNQVTFDGGTTYYLTSLPVTLNNLSNLKTFHASSNRIEGDIDLSNIITLTDLQLFDNRISGLKLGKAPFFSQLSSNPNLTCIEVPTSQVSNWETSASTTGSVTVDNGVAFSDNCTGFRVPQLEREALIAFYNATGGGTDWTGQFWDTDPNSLSNVGAWNGVTTAIVNGQKHIVKIDLSNRRLNGFIPSEIKNLTELVELNLGVFNGRGNLIEIKPEIGELIKLERLDLTGHKLTALPTEIGSLSSLIYLDLSNNSLTSLPAGIGDFAALEELRITSQNNVSTREKTLTILPDEIGNITSLKQLYLQDNKLTSLPNTIDGLIALEQLYLGDGSGRGNELSSLPATIGNLNALKILDIEYNRLISLPEEIGDLSNLENLSIANQVTFDGGTTYYLTSLPSSINNLSSLKNFNASANRIEGDIDLSNISTLSFLQFTDNRISGLKLGVGPFSVHLTSNPNLSCIEVPASEVSNWEASPGGVVSIDNGVAFSDNCTGFRVPQLEREALIAFYNATGGGTDWTGQFWNTDPSSISNVGAWGGVTTAIVNGQKHVVKLEILNRNLNGFIPSEIKNLTELQEINLSSTAAGRSNLTEIKPEIGELKKLERLDLSAQGLTILPDEIGDLSSLLRLNLNSNSLITLPSGIGNLASLEELYINNQIETSSNERSFTSLPSNLGNISTLKRLELRTNKLTSIPTSIGNLSNLEFLILEDNLLTELPTIINSLANLKELIAGMNRISGDINLNNLTVLNNLKLEYNNISNLKLNVSPTSFGTSNFGRFSLLRNACGCVEVPSDELVSWQLSEFNEQNGILDNGVVYSDNCSGVTNNSIIDVEREALIALFNATDGNNWRNDLTSSYNGVLWNSDITQKVNVGAWFGVTTAMINGQKHVTKIELNSNLLEGELPIEIRNLSQLKIFKISNNTISLIPAEIGELINLEQLTLSSQFDIITSQKTLSALPTEVNNLSLLKHLDIQGNAIEGNLDFSNLVNLTSLHVSSNEITGLKIGISPQVFDNQFDFDGGFSRSFSFSNAYLNCIAVPQTTVSDWGNSTFAQRNPNIVWGQDCTAYNNVPNEEINALVDMYNALGGGSWTNNENWTGVLNRAIMNSPFNTTKWQGITTEIVNGGKHITRINLSSNNLTGTLPESLGSLSELKYLDLNTNNLENNLPSSLNQLTKLETLLVSSNNLKGTIPDLTNITSLNNFYIDNNNFQFGDFENEFSTYSTFVQFLYQTQANVSEDETVELTDADYRLEAQVSGNNNVYQWYKNGSPITGANEASYDILNPSSADDGTYYCQITNTVVTGLTLRTGTVTATFDSTLSIENEALKNFIVLYPNPTNGIVNIDVSNNINIERIDVFSITGVKVKSIDKVTEKLNIQDLPSGVYMINIQSTQGRIVKRLIKK
ncbi:leucine-rich repeat domain-containing protein [uncultured Tenacibaculum sp.]|uniref:leucine-rich repeat domain-containing protein n=1 Tax=uncultured Tenacibaculum sp. TaxID=174713 RepID=UPI002621E9D9|nr:leucine-rich repeat domain-containing protein [uncultured Tenacibaculum sp.]